MIKKEWLWINELNKNEMDNNKLIAEFMGYEVKHGKCYSPKYNDGTIAPMQFHTSWDWLMPVVQKIDNMFGDDNQVDDAINRVHNAVLSFDIDNTYQAVVEFINEHNKYICGSCGDHVNEVVLNEDADVDECTNCTEYYER